MSKLFKSPKLDATMPLIILDSPRDLIFLLEDCIKTSIKVEPDLGNPITKIGLIFFKAKFRS